MGSSNTRSSRGNINRNKNSAGPSGGGSNRNSVRISESENLPPVTPPIIIEPQNNTPDNFTNNFQQAKQSEKTIEKPVKTPDHEKEAMTNPEQYLAKSDSGFSEKTNIELEELDDEDYDQDFVKDELSLEKAKKLFEKRVGANTSDGHDDITDDEEYMEEIIKSKKDGVRLREGHRQRDPKSYSSRRSSTDSSEEGFNPNLRDLKNELKDVEEKFRKAMVANASMDNEKSALTYQVELLKDQLEECEEQSALVTKELREKSRDYELLKRSHQETQRAVQLLQMQLDEQARLVAERGMVLIGNEEEDEDAAAFDAKTTDEEQEKRTRAIVSAETNTILSGLGSGPLDVRIKRLAEERDDLQDNVRRLKMDLDEEKNRSQRLERTPFNPEEAEWETKKVIDDYKFKLQKAEQDISTCQTNVARLETQVIRFKTAAETTEKSEEELKTERRKLQRENREATTRIEELETANKHLETRLGKLKTAKSNLLKDL